jgi:nicotinamide mononucleotide transporter
VSVLEWLFGATWHLGDQQILWREIIGNAFGLASAIGGMRRRVWAWPVGIVGNLLLLTVFLGVVFTNPQETTLYGQAGRQVFFLITSVYGWWRWRRNLRTTEGAAVTPRWATARERAGYLVGGMLAVLAGFVAFRALGAGFDAPWWYYLADSWIFVGSVLATYAMARGWVDFWLMWIAVDLVGVPELVYFGFYPSAVLYAVYAGFVIWGFVVWLHVARRESTAAPAARRSEELLT